MYITGCRGIGDRGAEPDRARSQSVASTICFGFRPKYGRQYRCLYLYTARADISLPTFFPTPRPTAKQALHILDPVQPSISPTTPQHSFASLASRSQ